MKKTLFSSIFLSMVVASSLAQPLPLDYSYCGYRQSEVPIPNAKNVIYVDRQAGDNSERIQRAIDHVASLKPDKHSGLRGAVLLGEGVFELSQPLRITASGVVLRGIDKRKTVLRKKGVDRGSLLYIEGVNDRRILETLDVADDYVKVGAMKVNAPVKAGDEVLIWRPSPIEWVRHLNCETWGGGSRLAYWGWHAGDADVYWDRTITQDGQLNAPLTTALDKKWGGAKVLRYEWQGRISDSGVENLTLESDFDVRYPMDEDHCWNGVYIASARDCWVRMVDFRHFAGSAVLIQQTGSRITVEDCISREPVSELGGMRRRTFYTMGGQTLFQRCYSEYGINDFVAGLCAPGPNAFVGCDTKESLGFSGSIGQWASGLLFDGVNIDGNDLRFCNLELAKYGAGWNTANSTMWQSTASGIDCYSPDSDAVCVSYGCWAQFQGNGIIEQVNEHVKPWSIFQKQLSERLGRDVSSQCRVLERETGASSSPTIEEAMVMAEAAKRPRMTMERWIDSARLDVSMIIKDLKTLDKVSMKSSKKEEPIRLFKPAVKDGRLVDETTGALLVGGRHNSPWWNGRLRYSAIPKATYALTRFVPGAEGRGLTDYVDMVVDEMAQTHTLLYAQNYGLWYDRRRDDHERVRRKDGDVWGPFYEQPFARSGQGRAWDGLSRYDLTRLNSWYYHRLNEFAEKGASEGLLLMNQHYFQHNILEAGAHWVDCPWRTANNINHEELLEPVPFTSDKRIFQADAFYDVSNQKLRVLHRQYIRQVLDAFKDKPNVIHSIGEEFTGPLHFVQFWIDCIGEWERENGQKVMVALIVNKDVQDAILQDVQRSKIVDIIGIEQWFYHQKGLYAPPGGVNMAPRQYMRKIRTGSARFEDVYRGVSEYRLQYPDKAVAYYAQKYPELAWAVLMAGGSCPFLHISDDSFLQQVSKMQPRRDLSHDGVYAMTGSNGQLWYKESAESLNVSLPDDATYILYKVDDTLAKLCEVKGEATIDGKGAFWLKKK